MSLGRANEHFFWIRPLRGRDGSRMAIPGRLQ
jgi:hypothetical protein